MRRSLSALGLVAILVACKSEDATIEPDPASEGGTQPTTSADASTPDTPGTDGGGDSSTPDSGEPAITPAAVLAKLANCNEITNGRYKRDSAASSPADVAVCQLKNAVFFVADMDIDCDGKPTTECNLQTDPAYQAQTAAVDSTGAPLDAAALPYVVVPGASARWDYRASGLKMGSVALVIYGNKMEFGILGDVGPTAIIGEASVAMAKKVGVNPNPKTGGVAGKVVTYVLFSGATGVVKRNEDHAEAVTVGNARLAQLMKEN